MSYLGKSAAVCGERLTFMYTSPYEHRLIFEVHRLSIFVFKKCSEKIPSRLNIVIRALRVLVGIMLAQCRRRCPRSITSALVQCIVLSGVPSAGMESVTA